MLKHLRLWRGTDRHGMPFLESYAFSVSKCALCEQPSSKDAGVFRVRLRQPMWADHARTEVLIPAGAQPLHRACAAKAKGAA